ncbi:hypothetical protein ACWCL1_08190 [Ligilactobacillus sp. LYQ135]
MSTIPYKKFYTGFNHKNLSAVEKLVLVEIYDRMKSARKSKDFFDSERGDYYVVYPINELSEVVEVSPSTIKNALKTLTLNGWLIIKRAVCQNNKIFISPDKQNLD